MSDFQNRFPVACRNPSTSIHVHRQFMHNRPIIRRSIAGIDNLRHASRAKCGTRNDFQCTLSELEYSKYDRIYSYYLSLFILKY